MSPQLKEGVIVSRLSLGLLERFVVASECWFEDGARWRLASISSGMARQAARLTSKMELRSANIANRVVNVQFVSVILIPQFSCFLRHSFGLVTIDRRYWLSFLLSKGRPP
jgi:hypothetical protein